MNFISRLFFLNTIPHFSFGFFYFFDLFTKKLSLLKYYITAFALHKCINIFSVSCSLSHITVCFLFIRKNGFLFYCFDLFLNILIFIFKKIQIKIL